jgi:hypothetical protein
MKRGLPLGCILFALLASAAQAAPVTINDCMSAPRTGCLIYPVIRRQPPVGITVTSWMGPPHVVPLRPPQNVKPFIPPTLN